MKHVLALTAFWKKVDIIFQCAMFALTVFVIASEKLSASSLFGLYIMGATQLLSSIVWIIYFHWNDVPVTKGSMRFRKAILIIAAVTGLSMVLNAWVFILLSLSMVIIGPILGINYFLLTLKELKYYSNARKPYYLL